MRAFFEHGLDSSGGQGFVRQRLALLAKTLFLVSFGFWLFLLASLTLIGGADAFGVVRGPVALGHICASLTMAVVWLALTIAVATRFSGQAVDDVFITYRYAQNLAAGNGFVFNPGERVFGVTEPAVGLLLGAAAWATRRVTSGSMVLISISVQPRLRPSSTPLGPSAAASTWGDDGSMVIAIEAPATAAAALPAGSAPSFASSSRGSGFRS